MPTLVLATGFGHGINVPAAWNKGTAGRLFADLVTGTPQIVSDGAGGFELEVSAAGATEGVAWDSNSIGTATGVLVAGFPVQVNSNTGNAQVAGITTSNASRDLTLWFRDSDDRLVMTESTSISSTTVGTPRPSIDPITLGQRYWIDVRIVVTGTTWAVDWAIDGVAQTSYTTTGMGSTDVINRMELGYRSNAGTYVARYKYLLVSRTSGDYPLGKHKTVLLKADTGGTAVEIGTANGTGRMVTNSAIDSTFNSANILAALAEGPPPTLGASASGVGQRTSGTGIAVGIPMTSYTLAGGESISGLRIEVVGWVAGTQPASLGLRTFNGTVETMLLAQGATGFDNNTTTPGFMCRMATAADFDTQAELDALVVRLGYSTDISPLPGAHAIYAEVAIKESTGLSGGATLTETATITAAGQTSGDASLTATATITAAGTLSGGPLSGSAAVAETATITSSGRAEGSASRSTTATISAAGQTQGAASLSATAALTAAGGLVAAGGTYSSHVTIAAARNGSTTHTVHPDGTGGTVVDGSAFTPTSGRLLVCFVEGAVTSTTASGWSLPSNGSAINNSGLYVFTRTASGTSADQVATTHNASDYPVVFDFYEFPAGSTFVGSASAAPVAANFQTGPTLSSLTGTNWTAGILGQANANTGSTGSVTWSTGAEEVDTSVVKATTDGYVYSLTYTIDDTASSVSYPATPSLTTPPLERLVVAVNVAAGPGGLTGTASLNAAAAITAAGEGRGSATRSETATITAAGQAQGAATLAETAAIVASGRAQGSASLAGTAAINSSGQAQGSSSPTWTATIVAAGILTASGSAAISETATITASGRAEGTSSLTEAATITAIGAGQGAVAVTETATISTSGRGEGSSSPSWTASITAAGSLPGAGSAAVLTTATITAAGQLTTSGTAALNETASILASGEVRGSSSLAETASIAASGQAQGSASRSTTAAITSSGQAQGSSSLTETAAITSSGRTEGSSSATWNASITAAGNMSGGALSGTSSSTWTAAITAAGQLQGSGVASVPVQATITAAGVLTTSGSASLSIAASRTAAGQTEGSTARSTTATVVASGRTEGQAAVTATATITAVGRLTISGQATLNAVATIIAAGYATGVGILPAAPTRVSTGHQMSRVGTGSSMSAVSTGSQGSRVETGEQMTRVDTESQMSRVTSELG